MPTSGRRRAAPTKRRSPSRCSDGSSSECSAFPFRAYFPQLGKSGLKPDFTPLDIIAHPFVFDAKGSNEGFTASHVAQIQGYVRQRSLQFGGSSTSESCGCTDVADGTRASALLSAPAALARRAGGRCRPRGGRIMPSAGVLVSRARRRGEIEHIRTQTSWASAWRAVRTSRSTSSSCGATQGLPLALAAKPTSKDRPRALPLGRSGSGRTSASRAQADRPRSRARPGVESCHHAARLELSEGRRRSAPGVSTSARRIPLLTRTLLYRASEDVQFVDEALYEEARRHLRAESDSVREAQTARPSAPSGIARSSLRRTTTSGSSEASRRGSAGRTRSGGATTTGSAGVSLVTCGTRSTAPSGQSSRLETSSVQLDRAGSLAPTGSPRGGDERKPLRARLATGSAASSWRPPDA